jgi:hypothetical protein
MIDCRARRSHDVLTAGPAGRLKMQKQADLVGFALLSRHRSFIIKALLRFAPPSLLTLLVGDM